VKSKPLSLFYRIRNWNTGKGSDAAKVTDELKAEPAISTEQMRCNEVVEGSQAFPEVEGAAGAENSKLSRSRGCFQPRKQTPC